MKMASSIPIKFIFAATIVADLARYYCAYSFLLTSLLLSNKLTSRQQKNEGSGMHQLEKRNFIVLS